MKKTQLEILEEDLKLIYYRERLIYYRERLILSALRNILEQNNVNGVNNYLIKQIDRDI